MPENALRSILSVVIPKRTIRRIALCWLFYCVAALAQQSERGLNPQLFAAGIVSTPDQEFSGSLSPDGAEFYFVVRSKTTVSPAVSLICVSSFSGKRWSEPEVVSFSGRFLDSSPFVSTDGRRLFFASKRPLLDGGAVSTNWNIFYVERENGKWGMVHDVGSPVNTNFDEINPSVASGGTLFFASDRESPGRFHIYKSVVRGGGYSDPVKLGPEVNGRSSDLTPFIAPDQSYLIFASADRTDTIAGNGSPYSRLDLYITVFKGGNWQPARHFEHGINTPANEANPFVSRDGKWLYFTSERGSLNVHRARPVDAVEWEAIASSPLNGSANVYRIAAEALDLK